MATGSVVYGVDVEVHKMVLRGDEELDFDRWR
jgi:hypothetical protein